MKINYQILNFTYNRHGDIDGEECYYCGAYADTIDHCPAISTLQFYSDYERILVKACRGCNAHLGAKLLPTLLSRVEYLIKTYRKKYRKYLLLPEWSDEELCDLKGSLKIYIESERNKVETCHKRIEFLMTRQQQLKEKP